MSEIVIAGNTSGSVTIAAPDVAGTTTLTLPATSGALVTDNGSGTVTATAFVGDGSGLTNLPIPPAGVTSLNGETGAIVNTNYGEVGTYIFAVYVGQAISENTTVAGASLQPAGIHGGSAISNDVTSGTISYTKGGATLAGTWRAMGRHRAYSTSNLSRILLWVRIS